MIQRGLFKARLALTLALVTAFFGCSSLLAQEFRATLSGQITDSTGAAVPGATVTVTNTQTGQATAAISGGAGNYHVGFLLPGHYQVEVEKKSFKTAVRKGIELQVAQQATVDIQLSAGNVSQSVVVTAGAQQLETQTADHGLTIGPQRVLTLPTQGRNPLAAAWSAPGVTSTVHVQRLRPFDTQGSTNMSINGGQPGFNLVLVDGMSTLSGNNNSQRTVSYVPTLEATSQLRVQSTVYDAQFGQTLGGVVNITTQGGTNKFHGAAWEYFQNTVLDANTFNANFKGTPRTSSHINTFGFDVGGPIIKNKLFFFYTFEDLRQVIPDPFVTSVPTPAQKSGDFSQTFYKAGQLQTIYNPFTTEKLQNGQLVRQPFPGNVIPNSMLDPAAVKVLSFIPNGNTAGNAVTGLNNLTNNSTTRKFTDYFPENTIRVDYDIDPSTRFFVRYSRNALQEERNFRYSTNSTINPADTGQNNPFTRENHNATVQLTKIFNPTTVLNLRIGFERYKSESGAQQGADHGPGTLGFSQEFAGLASNWFPKFNWANFEGAGAQPTFFNPISYTYALNASLEKVIGRETLHFGTQLQLLRSNFPIPGFTAGNFTFDQAFTGANPLAASPSSGNSIASFLLGTPASGYIQQQTQQALQQKIVSFFLQDGIQATDKLHVDLGLRWDYMGPITDRYNAVSRGFASTTPSPLQVPGQTLYGGLLFAGVDGNPRGSFNQSWGNFGPRLGVTYALDRNTVLRGGWGLVYGPMWYYPGGAPGFSETTQMVTSVDAGVPFNTLDNPFPTGILHPVGSSNGLATNLGQSLTFNDVDTKAPYVQQFSLGVQRQLPWNLLISAAYVGTRSFRLPVTEQLNAPPMSALGLGAQALTTSVANPFVGLIPGTALNNKTVQQQQLLAPYPQFLVGQVTGGSGITEQYVPIGRSNYDSGQFLLTKRMSQGLDFSVAYTISKQIDQNLFANAEDTSLEKVIAAWDIPQNLQINLLWQLPFGANRPYGANLVSPVRWAVSGWSFSALTRLQKGMPLDLTKGPNSVPIGNPALSNPSLKQWFNTCTLLANGTTSGCQGDQQPVWKVRQPFELQTWKTRLSSVRLPGIHNSDISLMKNSQIAEGVSLLFRTDFINAFNSPQFFDGPSVDVNNQNFGVLAGALDQSNLPRFIQFSMKLQF